eukprot:SAG11_NODE_136_length_15118_cov_14.188495_4_plen_116_part_00
MQHVARGTMRERWSCLRVACPIVRIVRIVRAWWLRRVRGRDSPGAHTQRDCPEPAAGGDRSQLFRAKLSVGVHGHAVATALAPAMAPVRTPVLVQPSTRLEPQTLDSDPSTGYRP